MTLKKFITKVFSFAFAFLLINAILIGGVCLLANKVSFKLPKDTHLLIIGDSHTTLGINDKFMPNAINISTQGEAYVYSYVKLKKFLDANKQIDTVMVSFNFTSLVKAKDEWVMSDNSINEKLPKFFPFFTGSEYKLWAKTPVAYLSLFRVPIDYKKGIFKLLTHKFKLRDLHLGGYEETKDRKVDAELKQKASKVQNKSREGFSTYQFEYLDKIIALSKQHGATVILINTPIFAEAQNRYTKPGYHLNYNDYYHDYYTCYKQKYADIPLWDFFNLQYSKDDFRDLEHLNYYGAKKFTLFLDRKREGKL